LKRALKILSNLILAACGGTREKEFFGDTPNPGREAAPPAPLLSNYDLSR